MARMVRMKKTNQRQKSEASVKGKKIDQDVVWPMKRVKKLAQGSKTQGNMSNMSLRRKDYTQLNRIPLTLCQQPALLRYVCSILTWSQTVMDSPPSAQGRTDQTELAALSERRIYLFASRHK